ncbi:hypothetical protein KI387_007556, partial [Taxus chinensis]
RGDYGCSSMGGGDEQMHLLWVREVLLVIGSLGGEEKGEMVVMLIEDSFIGEGGDEGCSSVGGGI